jgi:hypothetical protein
MIRRVVGRLLYKGPEGVEVMTSGGVSYELLVPATLLDRLPEVGQEVELHSALDSGPPVTGFCLFASKTRVAWAPDWRSPCSDTCRETG